MKLFKSAYSSQAGVIPPILLVILLVVGLVVGVVLVQRSQSLKSRASGEELQFSDAKTENGKKIVTSDQVQVELNAPWPAASIQTGPASQPTNLSYTCMPNNQVRVNWSEVGGATSYKLRIDNTSKGGWNGNCQNPNSAHDQCKDVDVNRYFFGYEPGDTYRLWAHAVNAKGESPASENMTFSCVASAKSSSGGMLSMVLGATTRLLAQEDPSFGGFSGYDYGGDNQSNDGYGDVDSYGGYNGYNYSGDIGTNPDQPQQGYGDVGAINGTNNPTGGNAEDPNFGGVNGYQQNPAEDTSFGGYFTSVEDVHYNTGEDRLEYTEADGNIVYLDDRGVWVSTANDHIWNPNTLEWESRPSGAVATVVDTVVGAVCGAVGCGGSEPEDDGSPVVLPANYIYPGVTVVPAGINPPAGAAGAAPDNTSGNSGQGGGNTGGSNNTPPLPPVYAVAYRLAESPTALETTPFRAYPRDGYKTLFTFANKDNGTKTVFVQFQNSRGEGSTPRPFSVELQNAPVYRTQSAEPTQRALVPTSTISGPSSASVGQAVNYSAAITSDGINSANLWVAKDGGSGPVRVTAGDVANFSGVFNCDNQNASGCAWYKLSSGNSSSLSGSFTPLAAGTYKIVNDVTDSQSHTCSSNPYVTYPLTAGGITFTKCGEAVTLTVSP